MLAPTLFAPATACASTASRAVTATTPGIASAAIAVASPCTSVDWARPARPPVCDVVAAALDSTKIRSVPSPRMRSVTPFCVPCPTAISTITELTPMIRPSEVSALRRRFAKIARRAMRKASSGLTARAPPPPRAPLRVAAPGRTAGLGGAAVLDDPAVSHADGAARVGGDLRLVRDQHHGQALLIDQLREQRHQLVPGRRIEGARRLVGEQHQRVDDERSRDRDALLLAAESSVGWCVMRSRSPTRTSASAARRLRSRTPW